MAPKRDNMLEAFRKAGSDASPPAGSPSVPPVPRAGKKPHKLRPAKKSSKASAQAAANRFESSLAAAGLSAPRTLPGVVVAAVLIAVAFGTGVLVGRKSAVEAANAEGQAGGGNAELFPAGIVPRGSGGARNNPGDFESTPAPAELGVANPPRSALMDPANEYTVAVVTYSTAHQDSAFEAYEHLALEGLPVFDPYQVGDNIVLMVGAAPRSEDLADLERRVRALSKDGVRGVYGDAFRIRIDQYVDRSDSEYP